LRPDDHAIVETPCYQSALEVARSTSADVSAWTRSFVDRWPFDLDALRALVRPNTRVLYLNQPHNPTGTLMSRETFGQVVALAQEHELTLFCDEVYRELEHDPALRLPAACDVDERAVSLGSISKTYGLPGLRIGWIATRNAELRARLVDLKHYTTICASAPSELLTAVALRHRAALVERSRAIVSRNLPLLDDFVGRHGEHFEWVRPVASPIAFPRVQGLGDVDELCARVAAQADVLLLPGSVYDQPDHVRLGYGRANMPEALERLDAFLAPGAGGNSAPSR
jgi:aspartate/methionine/tyrosine aminotransferase